MEISDRVGKRVSRQKHVRFLTSSTKWLTIWPNLAPETVIHTCSDQSSATGSTGNLAFTPLTGVPPKTMYRCDLADTIPSSTNQQQEDWTLSLAHGQTRRTALFKTIGHTHLMRSLAAFFAISCNVTRRLP